MLDTRSRLARLALAGALLGALGVARADDGGSDCPGLGDVVSRLAQLLGAGTVAATAAQKIVLRDHGGSWEIEAAGQRASYADPARDCGERARVATVFAALALEPPAPAEPALEPAAPAEPTLEIVAPARPVDVAPPQQPPSMPGGSLRHRLELSPELVLGLGAGDTTTAWGGALRWHLSGARLGLTVGLHGVAPAVVRAGAYEASLARVVLDVSPRVRLSAGSASFALELGPYAGLLFAKGRDLTPGASSTNVDAGVRGAVRFEVAWWRTVSPFVAVQAELGVRRFRLLVEPSGDVGSAPRMWLALLLGAAVGP